MTVSLAVLALAAIAPSEPPATNTQASAALRIAARDDANRRHRETCGSVEIPDEALRAVDVTGDGDPELGAFLGRAICVASGAPTGFLGTGGGTVQFWWMRGGRPVLILDESMDGFTPTADGLLAFQHGSYCGNYPGATTCVTTYRWDSAKAEMLVAGRRVYDETHPGEEPAMQYDWSGEPSR